MQVPQIPLVLQKAIHCRQLQHVRTELFRITKKGNRKSSVEVAYLQCEPQRT